MSQAARLLTLQFLAWLAERPRGYAETMDAWRTSCPRLPVWEECTDRGLVARRGRQIELTDRGRSFLERIR